MGLSGDTKDLLHSALGTPEARNEVINAIDNSIKNDGSVPLTGDLNANGHKITNVGEPTEDSDVATKAYVDDSPAGTGDIKSNGTVPFAADQSMGNHRLTNIEDPASDQDASTKAYVDILSALGASIAVHVNPDSGDDSTATGTITKPFKTLEAAQASFSDESVDKPYTLVLAPGTFNEAPTYIPKQYVNILGAGLDISVIKHNDDSEIDMTYTNNDGEFFEQSFVNLTFLQFFTITRVAVGPLVPVVDQSAANFNFVSVNFAGGGYFTGSGHLTEDINNGPFRFDFFFLYQCQGPDMSFNAGLAAFVGCSFGPITITDQGVDDYLPVDGGYANLWGNSALGIIDFTGISQANPRNTKVNRIRLRGTDPTYNPDATSWPAGNATNRVQFFDTNEITKLIFTLNGTDYDVNAPGLAIQLYDASDTGFYFWVKVTDGSNTQTDPGLVGTGTEIDITLADTPTTIATAFSNAIAAIDTSFATDNTWPTVVYVTNVDEGAATDATGDAAAVTVVRQGGQATMSQLFNSTVANNIRNQTKTSVSATVNLNAVADYILQCNGVTTVNLPEMSEGQYAEGRTFIIYDISGTAQSNNITINATGANAMQDGQPSEVIQESFGYRILTFSTGGFSSGRWHIIGSSGIGEIQGGLIVDGVPDSMSSVAALRVNSLAVGGPNIIETYSDDPLNDVIPAWTMTNTGVWKNDAGGYFTKTYAIDMGSEGITNMKDPIIDADAATKKYVDDKIMVFTSAAGAGGAATEVMTVTGLLASDTILSVSQMTPGATSQALIGYSTQANNALTGIWAIDPGAGSVIVVSVKR